VIGRRPVSSVAGALRALDAGGQRLLYVAADVADADAVRAAADAAEARWGRALDGVFHLAGTWEPRPLAEESAATLAGALHAKVGGALALHRLVAERPGTLVVHFGSLVGCFGGAASGAYAAANAFLIGLAHHERCIGLRSTCLSWSTWEGLGMNAGHELAAGLRAKGYRPLAADEGLEALWAALRCDVPHVLVGLEPRSALARRHVDDGGDDAPEPDRPRLAARTPTEGRLARIWADVLEQDAVGADETFFALGGDSLLAARVMAQIEAELGLDLPTAALFRAPTVAGLAAVVDRAGAGPRPYRLVPLRPEGRRAPLFCLPGAWDEAAVFADLVACLGPEQPVWGVQASSLDGTSRCDPAASFEAIAAGFVAEICALQPRGPYHLAGHCLGGLLAYEVAQQLVMQGEAVGLLALLDTLVGESLHTRTAAPMRLRLAHHGDALRHRPLRQRLAYLRAAAARLRHDRAARRHRRRELAPLEAMYQRYDLRPFPGRLVLVLASESFFAHDSERDPRLGWQRLAGGGCDLVVVHGDHESLLRPPHVRELAAGLEAALAAP
jgi:thioesterase domain-containing protein/acyl carrier protein